jgi:RNase P/RNase MRP subunit p30
MIDIVFPEQNEEKFISMAEKLGYSSLCFFYKDLKPAHKTHIEQLQAKTNVRLYTASFESKQRPDITIAKTIDPRPLLESRNIDVVFGMESNNERDSIMQKKSGLNHILCSIAKEKDKIIGFDFSQIISATGHRKAILIGRMMQNISLCRKYKVDTAIASFAHSPLKMRNRYDVSALFSMLGMGDREIKDSFSSVEEKIESNKKRKD